MNFGVNPLYVYIVLTKVRVVNLKFYSILIQYKSNKQSTNKYHRIKNRININILGRELANKSNKQFFTVLTIAYNIIFPCLLKLGCLFQIIIPKLHVFKNHCYSSINQLCPLFIINNFIVITRVTNVILLYFPNMFAVHLLNVSTGF